MNPNLIYSGSYFLITHLGAFAWIDVSNITKDLYFYAFFKETELIGRIAASLVDTNGALTLRTTAQDIPDWERERKIVDKHEE